jgi:hypothetical protein
MALAREHRAGKDLREAKRGKGDGRQAERTWLVMPTLRYGVRVDPDDEEKVVGN